MADTIGGSDADGLRVVRSVSRRVCVGPLPPGHGYVVRWRAVHEDEAGPVSADGDSESRGPWSRGVRVRVAGRVGTMVDLRNEDADDVGRALGLAGSQTRHSRRWLWVRGAEVVSVAGSRALRGVWLFGGLPRPSVTVRGSGVDADGGLVQPLVVRVSSSVDRMSVWTVQSVAVGDDGGERAGSGVECEGVIGIRGVVRVGGLESGWRYVVRGRVWSGGRESVSLWSCGVSVTTSSVMWLPRAQRLPAVDVGVDLGALSWGEPVTIDTAGDPCLPSVAALDDDRLVVAWLRYQFQDQSHASCAAVGRVAGPHRRHWVQQSITTGSRNGAWHPWARIGACCWSGSGTSGWCAVGHAWLVWQ